MKTYIKLLLVFIVAMLIGFGIMALVRNNGPKKGEEPDPIDHHDTVLVDHNADSTDMEKPVVEKPVVDVNSVRVNLIVEKAKYYYSVRGVKCSVNAEGIEYVLSDEYGHTYISVDGRFPNVAPNANGQYVVVARYTDSGIESFPQIIRGFYVQNPISDKLTAEELTGLIATGDYDGNKASMDGRVADNVKINSTDPEYVCNTLAEVFMSVGLEGWTVSVISVEYNCLNKVIGVTLSAQM